MSSPNRSRGANNRQGARDVGAGRPGSPAAGQRVSRVSRGVARNAPFQVRPLPALAIAVVLAIFIAGLVIGGLPGGLMIGLLVLVAAVLLALRWTAIDPRIRLFRLGVVVICLAVAITVVVRG